MSDPFFARYPDGTVRLRNPNIELMDQDILYHLALGSGSHDLDEMFGDVKVLIVITVDRSLRRYWKFRLHVLKKFWYFRIFTKLRSFRITFLVNGEILI